MSDFPSIRTPSDIRGDHYKGQVRAEFKAGYVHSHAAHTRSRKRFWLIWAGLNETDLASLLSHVDSNLGGTFNWTHPLTSVEYVVRYLEDHIPYDYVSTDPAEGHCYWVECALEEN